MADDYSKQSPPPDGPPPGYSHPPPQQVATTAGPSYQHQTIYAGPPQGTTFAAPPQGTTFAAPQGTTFAAPPQGTTFAAPQGTTFAAPQGTTFAGPPQGTTFAAPPQGTTVIVNQPMPGAPGAAPRLWSTGICGICDDMGICCCGLFCGLCLACQVSTDMGESYCIPILVPGADIVLRVKWRTKENIQGSIMDDCLTVWCCSPCAMCQLAREIKANKNGTLHPSA